MTMRSTRLSSALLTFAGITTLAAFPLLGGAGCSQSFTGNDAGNETTDDQDASTQDDAAPLSVVPPPDEPDAAKPDAGADARADAADADAGTDDLDATIAPPDATITDATPGGPTLDVTVDASTCNDTVDEAAGVFVSPSGAASACGSKAAPCGSIQTAIGLVTSTSGKSIVYLDHGTYNEAIALAPGITLQGGWNDIGGTWKRQCVGDPAAIAIIQAPASADKTVTALDFGGASPATLDSVRIENVKAAGAAAGQSLYGVFVRGATTHVVMTNVEIVVGAGGAGASGNAGGSGTTGANACSTASDGQTPTAGSNGSSGIASTFDSSGMTGTAAGVAGPGSTGDNGVAGSAPTCVTGSTKCTDDDSFGCIAGPAPGPSCGTVGTVGCGGTGGSGGTGGLPGGSSIALYAWGATVTVNQGLLASSEGGKGGAGGAAGSGGGGGAGVAGHAGDPVVNTCKSGSHQTPQGTLWYCTTLTSVNGAAGGAGGTGGSGSSGGIGGGGAGGVSFSYVQAGGAVVSVSAQTQVQHGAGGAGGAAPQAGPAGASGDHN